MIIFSSWLTSQSLLINEIVSSNSSIFYDEDGDTPDWIEIYNPSDIVVNLEKGDISLDDAIKAYEKGSILKDQCEKRLNEAKLKVEEIEEKENKNKNLKQSLDE